MQITPIEWVGDAARGIKGYTWNPTHGCNGPNGVRCPYCYMRPIDHRFGRSFEPTCHPERLDQPLRLKKPARIFVDSAGDLFDPAIPDDYIRRVFETMATLAGRRHTYIVLTKQAKRMLSVLTKSWWLECYPAGHRHIHLGVTVTNQRDADERIPLLLQTPAKVRFVSVEPLLGAVDLSYGALGLTCPTCNGDGEIKDPKHWMHPSQTGDAEDETWCLDCNRGYPVTVEGIDWAIVGGLTPKPAHKPEWVQSIIDQCQAVGVPLFLKNNLQWPEQIKEYPR